MSKGKHSKSSKTKQGQSKQRLGRSRTRRRQHVRPVAAHRHRGVLDTGRVEAFNAPEDWHEPIGRDDIKFVVQEPGEGYMHPVTVSQVRKRLSQLPERFTRDIEVIQFSRMTRKRALFPCYGMQWGPNIYLYPIEESLVESYVRPPRPTQLVEAKMFGARWSQDGNLWRLTWTRKTLRDFYLNNVLVHEVGHVNDERNTNFDARERYADWFAIEYGYRPSRR